MLVEIMCRALVIEDQDLMRLALIAELKANIDDCIVLGAQTLDIASEQMDGESFDLVIIDPGLPGIDPTSQPHRLAVVAKIIGASPSAIHLVVTGSDCLAEAEECRKIGATAYIGKTGLSRGVLANILKDVSTSGFSVCLSNSPMERPDFHYSGLTPREQEVVDLMTSRNRGTKRKQIYEQMGARLGIDFCTAEKYFKQARAKLLKRGRMPKGL